MDFTKTVYSMPCNREEKEERKSMKVNLNSVEKVKSFVNEVSRFDTEVDLVSSRHVIDAKSLMGIFSLDLSKPAEVEVCDKTKEPYVFEKLREYA